MLLIKLLGLNRYSIFDFSTEKTKKLDHDSLMFTILRLGFSLPDFNSLESSLWRCREKSKLLDIQNKKILDLEFTEKHSTDSSLMQIFKSDSDFPTEPSRDEPPGRIFTRQI